MPRSKQDILQEQTKVEKKDLEAQAAEPENVAARALAHRAKEDIDELWKRLTRKFALFAVEEVQAMFPHIKTKLHEVYGYMFGTSFGVSSNPKKVEDVMLAAILHAYIEETGGGADYKVEKIRKRTQVSPEDSDPEIEEFLLRERIYALVQEILAKESQDE